MNDREKIRVVGLLAALLGAMGCCRSAFDSVESPIGAGSASELKVCGGPGTVGEDGVECGKDVGSCDGARTEEGRERA